ncbi:Heavy metal tolerance protein [Beauveria bassiana]|uniref:Heavy metal tolerance protein n=1 Tax=Beauveria bassiana TaxID=176275 RepID=A0A2N6NC37_BEABA|nr:Heavy metal tolerance protein [Beauveria bassiana]
MEPTTNSVLDAISIAYPLALIALFTAIPFTRALFSRKSRLPTHAVTEAQQRRLRWSPPLIALTFRFVLGSSLGWSLISILLLESKKPAWPSYIIAWILTASCNVAQLVAGSPLKSAMNRWDTTHLVIQLLRILIAAVAAMYATAAVKRTSTHNNSPGDEETQSLLNASPASLPGQTSASYGVAPYRDNDSNNGKDDNDGQDSDDEEMNDDDKEEERMKRLSQQRLAESGWFGYLGGFIIFLPHLIPYKDRFTQLWLLVLIVCTCVDRVTTLLIPLQLANIIDALTAYQGTGHVPLKELALYFILNLPVRLAVQILDSCARTRISQFSKYQLNSLAFSHVMSLSMDYHTSRSTGKVITAIEQGTDLTFILDIVLGLGPRMVDLLIAAVYLTKRFDASTGVVMLMATVINAYVTTKGNKFTSAVQRKYVNNDQEENKVLYDAISNWYTVEIHNQAKREHERYNSAVMKALLSMRRWSDLSEIVFSTQEVVLEIGYIIVCFMIATRVADGHSTVSSFVFITSYWSVISWPIMSLAHQLHSTASQLVKAEWLYQLLLTKPSIQDKPGARPLQISNCEIEFKNVGFAYGPEQQKQRRRQILHNISFTAAPGQTIALVGETGSGKSTILKLLYRFYDVTKGSITIDGQDLRDVTLSSLRDSLGAVPQDPCVFDQTIMENLLYARPGATEADVVDACRRACIHEHIMTASPEGYRARIGERGVRLSGGELQRLAIARVLVRRPRIVVLDEATSAVDSATEASVQRAVQALGEGRTVFTVAHRLSTVVGAHRILLLHRGEVVESGTHRELLEKGGRYANLWRIQTAANNDGLL